MAELYYRDAQRKAQREFRNCVSMGEHPYLPILDDFVSSDRFTQSVDLGMIQLPMRLIVGTRTSGRTRAFARNFMPLLAENSEFALKWKALCKAHLEEGIRDAIKVYEYMNRFYVEEGNKRVSVLKFFDAVSVAAHVIRIMPERNGSREVELYYEFVDFYQCSKLNEIEFTRPGSYAELQRLLGKKPGEEWTEEERRDFSAVCFYFRQAYEAYRDGEHLDMTVGDAMLAYIRVYGFQELRDKGPAEVKKLLSKVWEEITLQQEKTPIALKLTPEENKSEGILSKILPKTEIKKLKAAFIYDKSPETSGWAHGHEMGRQHVNRVFQGQLETTAYFNAMDTDPLKMIEQAIEEENKVIFTTSPRLLPASLRAAVDHPDITILNCSLNTSHRYIRTYYARMYEAKFIAGAVAGSLAGSNHVGYICDYPIFGQVAGINAFALGVQMTNPCAKVFLEWSAVGDLEKAIKRLTDQGIFLISSQDVPKQGESMRGSFGLSLVNSDGQVNLVLPVWQWGVYYEAILRQIRDKSFQTEYKESSKALNYYWGMSAGVIDVRCSDTLPDGSLKLAMLLKHAICKEICLPFQGPLYAQGGKRMVQPQQQLTPEQIINMDWLVENVSGSIPTYEELNETGKATVGIVGVESTGKEAAPEGSKTE